MTQIRLTTLCFAIGLTCSVQALRAQTSAWCDVDPWPILAGCGSLSVGLQFSGDDVFCNGDTVTILNTLPSSADSTLVCWGDGSFTAVAGTPMTFKHVYAFPPDTCVDECITFIIRLAVLKHCPPDKMSFKWVATPVQVCFPPIAQFSIPPGVCVDDPVPVSNYSCENTFNYHYEWSFPGAVPGSDTTAHPGSIVYHSAGTYQVSVFLSNLVCGSDTYAQMITVGPPATAEASLPDTICVGEVVTPTNTSQNAAAGSPYFWSFPTNPGNGAMFAPPSTSIDATPQMKFTKPGAYVVRLNVSGCHNPFWTHTIVVKGPPVISLTDTLPDICTDSVLILPTQFFQLSNIADAQITWMSNGVPATVTGSNPGTILYSGQGIKTLCVDAGGQCGHPSRCDTFLIKPQAVAQFDIPAVLCVPGDTLRPINQSTNAGAFSWTVLKNGAPAGPSAAQFTNGTNAQSGQPEIRFLQEGDYVLRLSTGAAPCGTVLERPVSVHFSPTVSLAHVPTLCNDTIFNPSLLASFGGGTPDSIRWIFGNAIPGSATGQNPGPVQFSGLHTFVITVISQNVCDTVMAVDSFQIVALQQIALDTLAPLCSNANTVPLTATPSVGSWSGTGVIGNQFHPGSVPPASWNTPIQLLYSIGQPGTSCYVAAQMPVTVWGTVVNAGPPEVFCTDGGVRLLAGATPAGGLWSGAGVADPVTGAFDPALTPGTGNYTLTYTYTDPHGCTNTATKTVRLSGPPQVGGQITQLCVGELLPIDSFSVSGGSTCHWDFGDNTGSNQCAPQKSYTQPGTYNISLQAVNADGCDAMLTWMLTVTAPPDAVFSLDSSMGCAPLPVHFSNNSHLDGYTSYFWDFGNEMKDTTDWQHPDPVVALYQQGESTLVYTAVLTAESRCGTATQSVDITVFPTPIVRFGAARSEVCSSDTVSFHNYSVGESDTYQWWINGILVAGSEQLPPQYFTTTDHDSLYVITLIGSNECGSDTLTDTVLVHPNPVYAFFKLSIDRICQHSSVQLTDLSTNGLNVSWDFGDGNQAVGDTVRHQFDSAGMFRIYEYVNNGCGYDTTYQDLEVWPAPTALFIHPPYVCKEAVIHFENMSVGIAGARWAFGDGQVDSTNLSPDHTYAQAGAFPVRLVVFSQTHHCPDTALSEVLVRDLPVPVVQLSNKSGCRPLLLTGAGATPGGATYTWDFGDGVLGDQESFSHWYVDTGIYTLYVTVTDAFQCSADTALFPIVVHPKPLALFSVQQSDLCSIPAHLQFYNFSKNADAYQWEFSDGQASQQVEPSIEVQSGGVFGAVLYAENQWTCRDTANQALVIYGQPVVDFSIEQATGCAAFEAVFENHSMQVNHFSWDFGDGQVSTEEHPSHLYEMPGWYTVQLDVSADSVCFDSLTRTALVHVLASPEAAFSAAAVTDTTVVPNGIYRFSDDSSPDVISWNWDFGDGVGSSEEQNPIYQFDTVGGKQITLIVANALGCLDTARLDIYPEFFGKLFVPNALTPDSGADGERFFLPKGTNLLEYDLSIYAPNGQCVFHSTALEHGSPAVGWDGSYHGEPLPQGVYYWKVRAKFNNNRDWTGMRYTLQGVELREGKVWLGR